MWHCYKKHNNRASCFFCPFCVNAVLCFQHWSYVTSICEWILLFTWSSARAARGAWSAIALVPIVTHSVVLTWRATYGCQCLKKKELVDSISFGLIAWFICIILLLLCRWIDYAIVFLMSSYQAFTSRFVRMRTVLGVRPKHANVAVSATPKWRRFGVN